MPYHVEVGASYPQKPRRFLAHVVTASSNGYFVNRGKNNWIGYIIVIT